LHQLLQRGDRVAIAAVGLGGIGKTTLARRYAKTYEATYGGGIWWIAADRIATDILGYVERLGWRSELPVDWSAAQIVQHYLARWQQQFAAPKLVIVDNVEDYRQVRDFLPQTGTFQVLISARVCAGTALGRCHRHRPARRLCPDYDRDRQNHSANRNGD
jgi:KaiC/GvpD/RAD55 family RecA-like ATPase